MGDVTVDDGHFRVPDFVGSDAETGHFTRCASGGIDRDQRHLWLGGLIHAFVITDVPAVGGAQGNNRSHPSQEQQGPLWVVD